MTTDADLAYAGVGSRKTPEEKLVVIESLARWLAGLGWVGRSGHAPGADQAWERGGGFEFEIYLPWDGFERSVEINAKYIRLTPSKVAYQIAEAYHPRWQFLKPRARDLQARNTHQVLGRDCETPAQYVLCWTLGGREVGGTAQAMRLAGAWDIPIINLALPESAAMLKQRFGFVVPTTTLF